MYPDPATGGDWKIANDDYFSWFASGGKHGRVCEILGLVVKNEIGVTSLHAGLNEISQVIGLIVWVEKWERKFQSFFSGKKISI